MRKIVILIVLSIVFIGCNKVEGEGGTSSITGKLIVNDLNGLGNLQATFPGADEDVFIVYGKDNTTYNDKVSTSYDGTYRFDNLTEGSYKLFSYSKCDTCASGSIVVSVDVEISAKKQVIEAADIVIIK
tara:strand:- start:75 stop:461 length:387 start_codon:yes stop_codon:yes gene_type:complete